jgi:phosphoglycolate phosphatase
VNLFFDLDGTLLDSSDRLYRLFQDLTPESKLTKKEYWDFKKNKKNHRYILKNVFCYNEAQIAEFENKWLGLVETEKYLDMDAPVANVLEMLNELKNAATLYIVTARQSRSRALAQLQKLGLQKYFKDILVTENITTKEELIKKICNISPNDCIIGDTGKDVECGKNIGIRTMAVSWGFLSKEKLETYSPDFFVSNITEIKNNLNLNKG